MYLLNSGLHWRWKKSGVGMSISESRRSHMRSSVQARRGWVGEAFPHVARCCALSFHLLVNACYPVLGLCLHQVIEAALDSSANEICSALNRRMVEEMMACLVQQWGTEDHNENSTKSVHSFSSLSVITTGSLVNVRAGPLIGWATLYLWDHDL